MNEISINLPVIWKWGKRVGFSVLDQGMFSGANFVLSILLGRWLEPDIYGSYAVAYSIMLILAGIQSSLIYEPMMVFGLTKFHENLLDYIKKLSQLQLAITLPLMVSVIIIALFLEPTTRIALTGMALAMPFYLAIWFLRQSCYLEARSGIAATSSLIYFGVSIVGILVLVRTNLLTLSAFYGLNILSSLSGIAFLVISLTRNKKKSEKSFSYLDISQIHWNYGRWILPATIANSIAILIITPVFSLLRGLDEAGALKAYQNLITPITQLFGVLNLLSLPVLSKIRARTVVRKASNILIKLSAIYFLFLVAYLVPLHFLGNNIISMLYYNNFYLSFSEVIILIEIIITLYLPASLLGVVARMVEKPKAIFYAKTASAGVTLLLIYPFVANGGLFGAFYLIIICLVIEIITLGISTRSQKIIKGKND